MSRAPSERLKQTAAALIVMALWGSLFPCIKLGYSAFNINTKSVPDIMLFAGVRFFICGIAICIFTGAKKMKFSKDFKTSLLPIMLTGIFSVVLHYTFTYVGLSLTDSSKTAILKQLGTLLYICFCFLFIKEERFSIYKITGALVGFAGITAINAGGGKLSFSVGDLLIILASFCTVFANTFGKSALKNNHPFVLTGVSQLFGGAVMVTVALISGAKFSSLSLSAVLVFTYICAASVASYCHWYKTVEKAELSSLFIIKFAEPVFACIFGALLLGENIFRIQYLISYILIAAGIIIGSKRTKPKIAGADNKATAAK